MIKPKTMNISENLNKKITKYVKEECPLELIIEDTSKCVQNKSFLTRLRGHLILKAITIIQHLHHNFLKSFSTITSHVFDNHHFSLLHSLDNYFHYY